MVESSVDKYLRLKRREQQSKHSPHHQRIFLEGRDYDELAEAWQTNGFETAHVRIHPYAQGRIGGGGQLVAIRRWVIEQAGITVLQFHLLWLLSVAPKWRSTLSGPKMIHWLQVARALVNRSLAAELVIGEFVITDNGLSLLKESQESP